MENTNDTPASGGETRTPDESSVIMTELVLPAQTNLLGNLLGGQMMNWMDIAGALACHRHSGADVATVAVDGMEFRHPVRLGEIVTLTARIVWVGRTSMKVRLEAGAENPRRHTAQLTNIAFFTYVALGPDGRPVPVPPLRPVTAADRAAFGREEARYRRRKRR